MASSNYIHRLLMAMVVIAVMSTAPRAFAQPNDLVVEVCGAPTAQAPGEISDTLVPVQNLIIIPPTGSIHDLDVSLDVNHTWVGDLLVVMTHIETGTSVVLVDRPGVLPSAPAGCGADNLDIVLDDEGLGGPLDNQCSATGAGNFPSSPPNYVPINALSAFDGEQLGGSWLITITDVRPENSGALISWCLRANLGPAGIRSTVSAEVNTGVDNCAEPTDELVVAPGTSVRVCYTVENIGQLALNTHTLVSSFHGDVVVGAIVDLGPGDEHHVTRLALINQDTTITGTWHSRIGVAAVSANDSIVIRIDSDGDGVSDHVDGCPQDPDKIEPGECGCGVPEGSCGGGNENGNGNNNTNGNENTNENTNENANTNENSNNNGNENQNSNENVNENSNSNENENQNANNNTNGNDNQNGNNNNQNAGNQNANQNQNANNNANGNAANNINSNDDDDSNANENENGNNINENADTNEPRGTQTPADLFANCGNGLCGAGANAYLALSFLFVFAARNRKRK